MHKIHEGSHHCKIDAGDMLPGQIARTAPDSPFPNQYVILTDEGGFTYLNDGVTLPHDDEQFESLYAIPPGTILTFTVGE